MYRKQLLAWVLAGYLGLYQGHLALLDQHKNPIRILPYPAHHYSIQDQQALQEGIPFSDERQQQKLLEDYLS